MSARVSFIFDRRTSGVPPISSFTEDFISIDFPSFSNFIARIFRNAKEVVK